MIQIRNLRFEYATGNFRLSVSDFDVRKGERVAVIGPSGSGKTTLLNLVSGILQPDDGSVTVGGQRVDRLDETQRRDFRIRSIGFIFQNFELLDYLNVLDNILLPYRITGALQLDESVRSRGRQLAERMGMGDKLDRASGDLSQGEKQRVAICRALLSGPNLIIADEATGNLDPENKTLILDLLFQCVREEDATLLAVTHDHELLPHFDRVVDFRDFRRTNAA